MRYYLYKFKADSFDSEGFAALTETQKDIVLSELKRKYKRGGDFYVGDDAVEVESFQELAECFVFEQITESEYNTLHKLFNSEINFESGCFGELGPLVLDEINFLEDEDYEDDKQVDICEECGEDLNLDETNICDACREEQLEEQEENRYNECADKISDFIKKTYGLLSTPEFGKHSKFVWKPTTKSEIEITIVSYDESGGEDEVEISLKVNNKNLRYEFFDVDSICNRVQYEFNGFLKEFIEKAKKY